MTKARSPALPTTALFQAALVVALIGFGMYFDHSAADSSAASKTAATLHDDLVRESASPEVGRVAQWAVHSQDHAGLPFLVVDKTQARLFAFDPHGRLRASTSVLLAPQDEGSAATAAPAGRFVSDTWLSAKGNGIVWVNADASLSLRGVPSENSQAPDGGSLRVEGQFYREHLTPLKSQGSVAYVLPEFLPSHEVSGTGQETLRDFAQSLRPQPARRPS